MEDRGLRTILLGKPRSSTSRIVAGREVQLLVVTIGIAIEVLTAIKAYP